MHMFGKLSVASLLAASPAFAQEAPMEPASGAGAGSQAEAPVAYKTKRVCRSIEVVGSSIPRTTCTTKKIPIKPAKQQVAEGETTESAEAKTPDSE
jgi:hypothetical protein